MLRNRLTGLDKTSLRNGLLVFFVALLIPTAILIQQSYSRLKWEAFHQHQLMADELATRIDQQFLQLIDVEQRRPFTDYAFLNVVGDVEARFIQRSPLSLYPAESTIPGLIGYFQVDAVGKLMTPVMPDMIEDANSYGITDAELTQRLALHSQIQTILSQNHLVQNDTVTGRKLHQAERGDQVGVDSVEADMVPTDMAGLEVLEDTDVSSYHGQVAFDELKKSAPSKTKQPSQLGRIEDLKLDQRFQTEQTKRELEKQQQSLSQRVKATEKKARTEQNVLPESVGTLSNKFDIDLGDRASSSVASPSVQTDKTISRDVGSVIQQPRPSLRIRTFESEVDPFEFSQLDSGHFVLFRKVWLNDQRYIQGFLLEQQPFLTEVISKTFLSTSLAHMSNLLVVYQGNVLQAFTGRSSRGYLSRAQELNGELLYQTRLSDPLSDMQLLFSITQLPVGPGGRVIMWLALILALVLCVGFYLLYRLGVGQINLANQQQDFVSAVSHELKTPLTSIRLYGEMLREGWASEDKKKTYYDFIFDESERLSRLINNVLLMAKMTRNKQQADIKTLTVTELIDGVRSKVSSQIEHAGFELHVHCSDKAKQARINVDADWFSQIMINLVDNAIKFSVHAENKVIEVSCQTLSNGNIQFSVRDYGLGVDKAQMKKIFQLFYRSESELTRETVGTGIGLALVHQMVVSMKGQIDVINTEPGAEFRVIFPMHNVP